MTSLNAFSFWDVFRVLLHFRQTLWNKDVDKKIKRLFRAT